VRDLSEKIELAQKQNSSITKESQPFKRFKFLSSMISKSEEQRIYWLDKMGKYSWITSLNQLFVGIGLIYLAIWLAKPYLGGWITSFAVFLFLTGSIYGWYTSKGLNIYLRESGAVVYSQTGLWLKFAPMFLALFVIRSVLVYLDRQDIIPTAPFMRSLTFFLAGVFLARSITILVLSFRLLKNDPGKVS
jgi:hypothetical protein